MNTPVVKFNIKDQPSFFAELRKRVNGYFKENNISKHANANMVTKTVTMLALYFVPFILMLTGVVENYWLVMGAWLTMGVGMSGIGSSIMHDANHGSYSKNQKINDALGSLITFIGGYKYNWRMQHNVLHHTFTNVDGYDDDIESALFRLSPGQERKKMHKFQVFYAPIFYGLMTVQWSTVKDFAQLKRYRDKNLLKAQKLTYSKALRQVVLGKLLYYAIFLVLPLTVMSAPWWLTILGFLGMHYVCGLILAMVFQTAHVIEETNFYGVDDEGGVENSWAIHQLRTTANFSRKSKIFSWFIGGLNYQIEHHLFPSICHVHYPKIASIVKETAQEYGIPYYEHKTFAHALKSHFALLHGLGTGKLDQKLAA